MSLRTDEDLKQAFDRNQELHRLADLGRKVEALLASKEPPDGLIKALAPICGETRGCAREDNASYNLEADAAWGWFREQFIAPDAQRGTVQNMGYLATGGINPAEEAEEDCGYAKPDDPTGLGIAAITPKPWRLARSLSKLRGQLAELYPKRSRASDGTIGDARHASNKSDHNPYIPDPDPEVKGKGQGVVTAIDITHDPESGCNCETLADRLSDSRDGRIKYIIWDREIWNPSVSPYWRPYTGSNPHAKHLHLSVKSDPNLFDSTEPWRI